MAIPDHNRRRPRGSGSILVPSLVLVALLVAALALNSARHAPPRSLGPFAGAALPIAIACAIGGTLLASGHRSRSRERSLAAEPSAYAARVRSGVFALLACSAVALPVALLFLWHTPGRGPGIKADEPSAQPSGHRASGPASPSASAAPHAGGHAASVPHLPLVPLLLGLGVLALLAVTALVAVRLRTARRRTAAAAPAPDGDREALADAVDAGRAALLGDDPRAAIIACYAAMESALAGRGVAVRRSDSPSDLLARAARRSLLVGPAAAAAPELAALFREARYSTHPMTEAQRADARRALDELSAGLNSVGPDALGPDEVAMQGVTG